MPTTTPTKREALTLVERGHREVMRLIDDLPPRALTRTGIGGGAWSPADLIGHLAAWEGFALDALHAWSRGERAPIDIALDERGLNGVNADALTEASTLKPTALVHRSLETHAALVAAVRAVPADRWAKPPITRGRPLGLRVGSILGGPGGPFRHADAHLP
ncbi:MAG: DinB family protein, partial [Thermoanaerobaculia bacterium]